MAKSTLCFLCAAPLEAQEDGTQLHPDVVDCEVRFTDAWGVPIAEPKAVKEPEGFEPIDIRTYPSVEDVLNELFAKAGVPRLGGISTGHGWSFYSTFMRCPYAWNRRYRLQLKPSLLIEAPSLAIGTLIHTFLASYYALMIEPTYELTPRVIYDVTKQFANPVFVEEAWRVFTAYQLFYSLEVIQPLAIEHDLKDPRTGESCRYDLVAFFPESIAGRPPGTYIVEHKSTSRFDSDTLDGWVNDGEVIGQVALWKQLGLDLRFGKLQGVIVNLLGKHKVPQFHRTVVGPDSWQIDAHLNDLRRWEGLIQLSISTESFPRARQGCISRYGRCQWFDHCAHGEE